MRHRQAVALRDAAQQEQVADLILGGPEAQEDDLAGGIVDGPDQGGCGPAPFQPVKGAAVDLQAACPRLRGVRDAAGARAAPVLAGLRSPAA